MRLFVGAWPSPTVRAALAGLDRPDHPAVRWTVAAQWHLTFRFLGEVDDAAVPEVLAAVDAVAAGHRPRTATLGPATTRLGRHALVVPVSGVGDLGESVVEATRALGRPAEARPFSAHVTLARGRGRRPVPAALAGAAVSAAWDVASLAVVRSTLTAAGARYETVATGVLRGTAPAAPG